MRCAVAFSRSGARLLGGRTRPTRQAQAHPQSSLPSCIPLQNIQPAYPLPHGWSCLVWQRTGGAAKVRQPWAREQKKLSAAGHNTPQHGHNTMAHHQGPEGSSGFNTYAADADPPTRSPHTLLIVQCMPGYRRRPFAIMHLATPVDYRLHPPHPLGINHGRAHPIRLIGPVTPECGLTPHIVLPPGTNRTRTHLACGCNTAVSVCRDTGTAADGARL